MSEPARIVMFSGGIGSWAATKSLALHMAGKLMPEDAGLWTARRGYITRAHGIGRAEAALIGLYGIRSFNAIATGAAA